MFCCEPKPPRAEARYWSEPPQALAHTKQPNPKQNTKKRSKTDWWGVCDGILGHACPKYLMSSLVFDTTSREAVGAAVITIGADVARVEAQAVPADRTLRCGHPAVAVRANAVELAIGCSTTAASGEER